MSGAALHGDIYGAGRDCPCADGPGIVCVFGLPTKYREYGTLFGGDTILAKAARCACVGRCGCSCNRMLGTRHSALRGSHVPSCGGSKDQYSAFEQPSIERNCGRRQMLGDLCTAARCSMKPICSLKAQWLALKSRSSTVSDSKTARSARISSSSSLHSGEAQRVAPSSSAATILTRSSASG